MAIDELLANNHAGSAEDFAEGDVQGVVPRTPEELAAIVSQYASNDDWISRVRLNPRRRWYERLHQERDYDLWLISWLPGQSTGFHDHGESSGAFAVTSGVLEEHRLGEEPLPLRSGERRAFGPDYAHDVRNASDAPAVSIHAYSPPLKEMNEYELEGSQLVPRQGAPQLSGGHEEASRRAASGKGIGPSSIEEVLAAARTRLRRLSPDEALRAAADGAVLVDIRPEAQRTAEGGIPGALIIERNVLEWRLDPLSSARLAFADEYNTQLIVFCSEGYASSLAAADLQNLGLWRATDLIGGFQAWRAAGLPNTRQER